MLRQLALVLALLIAAQSLTVLTSDVYRRLYKVKRGEANVVINPYAIAFYQSDSSDNSALAISVNASIPIIEGCSNNTIHTLG